MRVIRKHAPRFKIDPSRVGASGFSAGGFLTETLATRHGANFYDAVDSSDAIETSDAEGYRNDTFLNSTWGGLSNVTR